MDKPVTVKGGDGSHFITGKLLEALRGERKIITHQGSDHEIIEGGYLWGVDDPRYEGILHHVLQVSRVAYRLAEELKKKQITGFEDIDLQHVVEAALLHDVGKLYGQSRENLPDEVKASIGLPEDFSEMSDKVEEEVHKWLRGLGFHENVIEAITAHDFPEKIIDNPYWKIIIVADYMAGQKIVSVKERLGDIKTRWIDEPIRGGSDPRVDPARFEEAQKNILKVANEVFSILLTTDEEFISEHDLNGESSVERWERFLRKTNTFGKEGAEKVLDHVKKEIG